VAAPLRATARGPCDVAGTGGRIARAVTTLFAPFPLRPLRPRDDRLAKLYDDEIHPLVDRRLGEMLLRAVSLPPRAQVLELGCRAGALTAALAGRLDEGSRLIAVDPAEALLARARVRLGDERAGRRVFFRAQDPDAPLPFAEESFDVVVANLAGLETTALLPRLRDLARVTRPGGDVHVAVTLRGTWGEPLDLFEEALLRLDRPEATGALRAHVALQPEGETVARGLEAAGLGALDEELARWELLFKTAREFFYAPVVEYGPLPRWKEIAGRGAAMHEAFFAVKEAIDTYFAGRAFAVGIFGGRFSGRKPPSPTSPPPLASSGPEPESP
jgi:SAM-dependent methyltransferase